MRINSASPLCVAVLAIKAGVTNAVTAGLTLNNTINRQQSSSDFGILLRPDFIPVRCKFLWQGTLVVW